MDRVILYIDGFNFYYGIKERGWYDCYWLDPFQLGMKLLRENQQLLQVKYFTARISEVPSNPEKHKRQGIWLEAVEDLHNTQVFYGHYLSKVKRCFKCGSTWVDHEEKMTDVKIAVEMMRDAYEDRFDLALVVSGDSDLAPPIEAIRSRFPAKRIIVTFPPKRKSKQLESVANASFMIGRKVLQDSQFPDEFKKADGYTLKRPESWK